MLFLCTGNTCRSPMAEAMLSHRLAQLGVAAVVRSAGMLDDGMIPPADAVAVMGAYGLDTSGHRSTRLTRDLLDAADLVVGMAREHVYKVAATHPDAWTKTFTLKELVRRAESVGARTPGQPFDEWVAKLGAGRTRTDLLASSADDVEDPIGRGRREYERTAAEIDGLVSRLAELGWGAL